MTRGLVPELYVIDLARSLAFWVDALGFEIEYERPEEGFAALKRGDVRVMLEVTRSTARASADEIEAGEWRPAALEAPLGRGVNFELTVADVDAIHARVLATSATVVRSMHNKTYRVNDGESRVRQFVVADPDGYLVRPSQKISAD